MQKSLFWMLIGLLLGAGAATLLMSSLKKESTSVQAQRSCFISGAQIDSEPLFEWNGKNYAISSLPRDLQIEFAQFERQMYDRKVEALEKGLLRMVLAAEKKVAVPTELLPGISELVGNDWVKNDEVRQFYEKNKSSFPSHVPFEQLESTLRTHLETIKIQTLTQTRLSSLKNDPSFRRLLLPPCGPKIAFTPHINNIYGNSKAINKVLMLVDYSCAFCRGQYQGISEFLKENRSDLQTSFLAFAANLTGSSATLAAGAFCANEQNADKGFAYHRSAYALASSLSENKGEITDANLDSLAKELQLDAASFKQCVRSNEAKEVVAKNSKLAAEMGLKDGLGIYLNNRQVIFANSTQLIEIINSVMPKTAR